MANIALVTDTIGDVAAQAVISALVGFGHTVSPYAQSDTSVSLLSFDLIIGTRLNSNTSSFGNVINAFNNGVPVIFGFNRDLGTGIGPSSDFLGGKLGLISALPNFEAINKVTSLTNEMGERYAVGTFVLTNTVADYCSTFENNKLATGAIPYFSSQNFPETHSIIGFAAKGATNLLGSVFPAACAYAGFLYINGSSFTSDGKELIGAIVEKVLSLNYLKTHTISGYVLDENDTPLANKVMLYNQDTKQLEAIATPDAAGQYEFNVEKEKDFFVVCESLTSDKNFKVYGFVQGVLV